MSRPKLDELKKEIEDTLTEVGWGDMAGSGQKLHVALEELYAYIDQEREELRFALKKAEEFSAELDRRTLQPKELKALVAECDRLGVLVERLRAKRGLPGRRVAGKCGACGRKLYTDQHDDGKRRPCHHDCPERPVEFHIGSGSRTERGPTLDEYDEADR